MLKEKDPIALELYNRYKKILMPNLRLSDTEVEALLEYMESNTSVFVPEHSQHAH